MSEAVSAAEAALTAAIGDRQAAGLQPKGLGAVEQLLDRVEEGLKAGLSLGETADILAGPLELSPSTVRTYLATARRSRRDAQNLAAMKPAAALISGTK